MEHMEMVEKLREKTGVTYDEAKEVLVKTNWDMLDALIELERQGKIKDSKTASYSTKDAETDMEMAVQPEPVRDKTTFGELFRRFISWVGKWVQRGNQNYLRIEHKEKTLMNLSVTVLVLLLLIAFWLVAILMIVGLFCGCRYSFWGPHLGREDVNQAMNKAHDMAEDLKQDFQNGFAERK